MAVKKKKQDIAAVAMNAGMAFGGGVGGEIIADMIAKKAPDWVAENPKLAEAAPAAVGLAGLFFMPGKMDPLFYGMCGAAGAGLSDDIIKMEGFSRTRGMDGNEADEYAQGVEFVEELQKKAFDFGADED